jgi:hypothetical protein
MNVLVKHSVYDYDLEFCFWGIQHYFIFFNHKCHLFSDDFFHNTCT